MKGFLRGLFRLQTTCQPSPIHHSPIHHSRVARGAWGRGRWHGETKRFANERGDYESNCLSTYALVGEPMRYLLWHLKFSTRPSHQELPPIPPCALPQSKNDLANVLDVGFLFCLVCVIPFRHELAIHRALNYGVVVGERLPIFNGLFFKLGSYVLAKRTQIPSQCTHDLVVFCLALSLFAFHKLLALAHFLSYMFNERMPQVASSIFNLLFEGCALRIVLGYVFQFPNSLFCALVLQRFID